MSLSNLIPKGLSSSRPLEKKRDLGTRLVIVFLCDCGDLANPESLLVKFRALF